MSYVTGVYKDTNGNRMVVASTGTLRVNGTLDSTGTMTLSATVTHSGTMTNTGTITNSGSGTMKDSVAASTLSAVIPNIGISTVGSSSGTTSYKLAAPVAGCSKTIAGYAAIGGDATITSTAATIGSTQGTITVGEAGGAIKLEGLSVTRWVVVGMSTGASVA